MTKLIIQSLKLTLVFTVLTGLAYPLLITGIAQTFFRDQANGSLQISNGKIVGSTLLSQKFESPRYFWPRPSASNFETVPSGASNQGPTSQILQSAVLARIEAFRDAHALNKKASVPADMAFQSGSGLDPHISPESASLQIHRVARSRNIPESMVQDLVAQTTEPSQYGFLGERRANVLLLNLALDRL